MFRKNFLLSSRSPRPLALDKNNLVLRACMLCGGHILGLLSSIHVHIALILDILDILLDIYYIGYILDIYCMLCGCHILGLLSSIHDQRGETLPLYWINFTTSCDRTQEKRFFMWWFWWRAILFIFNHM